jgi:hypothetical protein
MSVHGLDQFGLNEASFRRLRDRRTVTADVNLRTCDLTRAVRKLPPSKRRAYLVARADRWIESLYRDHPGLEFHTRFDKVAGEKAHNLSGLPFSIKVTGTPRKVLRLADARGVSSVYIEQIDGYRRLAQRSQLAWYCVRAFVVISVERESSGLQGTEDRFMLVCASSCDDAKNRLKKQWREYATPYLNSDFAMVSWRLGRIVDVYETSVTEMDPAGTEIYSKLGHRKMRPKYVWKPQT